MFQISVYIKSSTGGVFPKNETRSQNSRWGKDYISDEGGALLRYISIVKRSEFNF